MEASPDTLNTILSIAGSDTSAGAGIQADIKTAALCNTHAITVITAVTAQSTKGISDVFLLPSSSISAQLEAALYDTLPSAVKIGLIGSVETAYLIASFLDTLPSDTPIVIDPVLSATSGRSFIDNNKNLLNIYLDVLLPRATIVTPNLIEAARFLNLPEINPDSDTLLSLLSLFGSKGIVLKGGHGKENTIRDLFVENRGNGVIFTDSIEMPRIICNNLHGTGCCYSTLIASAMAMGLSAEKAFRAASAFVWNRISLSSGYLYGNARNGPLNLLSNHGYDITDLI